MKSKQSNPPENGFADEAVVGDETGTIYHPQTEIATGFGSPLGEHEDGYNQNERRKKNREKKNDNKTYNSGRR